MKPTTPPSAWWFWSAACAGSALLVALTLRGLPHAGAAEAWLAWLVTGILAAAGYALLPRALGPDSTRFLVYGLGGQLFRLGILLVLFVISCQAEKTFTLGFVSGGLVSYLAHLLGEVTWLAQGTCVTTAKT